jgi:hypothetical protein
MTAIMPPGLAEARAKANRAGASFKPRRHAVLALFEANHACPMFCSIDADLVAGCSANGLNW